MYPTTLSTVSLIGNVIMITDAVLLLLKVLIARDWQSKASLDAHSVCVVAGQTNTTKQQIKNQVSCVMAALLKTILEERDNNSVTNRDLLLHMAPIKHCATHMHVHRTETRHYPSVVCFTSCQ